MALGAEDEGAGAALGRGAAGAATTGVDSRATTVAIGVLATAELAGAGGLLERKNAPTPRPKSRATPTSDGTSQRRGARAGGTVETVVDAGEIDLS